MYFFVLQPGVFEVDVLPFMHCLIQHPEHIYVPYNLVSHIIERYNDMILNCIVCLDGCSFPKALLVFYPCKGLKFWWFSLSQIKHV